jgi:hypothetical protein
MAAAAERKRERERERERERCSILISIGQSPPKLIMRMTEPAHKLKRGLK